VHRARGLDLSLSGSAESQLSFGVQREPCSKSGTTMTKGLFGRSICENAGRWWLAPPTASLQRTLRRAHAKHTETEMHNIRAHTHARARAKRTLFSPPAPSQLPICFLDTPQDSLARACACTNAHTERARPFAHLFRESFTRELCEQVTLYEPPGPSLLRRHIGG
jgi:hypothetical protein